MLDTLLVTNGHRPFVMWHKKGFALTERSAEPKMLINFPSGHGSSMNGPVSMFCVKAASLSSETHVALLSTASSQDRKGTGDASRNSPPKQNSVALTSGFAATAIRKHASGDRAANAALTANESMWYLPGFVHTYDWSYTATTTAGRGAKTTYSDEFAVDAKLTLSPFFLSFSDDLKNSETLTWVDQWNQLTTTMMGESATVLIHGPSGFGCADEYNVLEDNVYGTFMVDPI